MSSEVDFDINGGVKKQNYRIWGSEKPHNDEGPLSSSKITVWCGVTAKAIIGPYFFEDTLGQPVTVNGVRYTRMLEDFVRPEVERLGMSGYWFQQDEAAPHTARGSMGVLKRLFPKRIMSRLGNIPWPAKSPDLTAPDFFLWVFLKDTVYEDKPSDIKELKYAIKAQIRSITSDQLSDVMDEVITRADACVKASGNHLQDIISHA